MNEFECNVRTSYLIASLMWHGASNSEAVELQMPAKWGQTPCGGKVLRKELVKASQAKQVA